ncbi:MAG TPA: hypothetical protein VKU01_25290 [Bryobacteraceae bacterium]|nr:hypothetical protein [Bryobacteraceae bacterium]
MRKVVTVLGTLTVLWIGFVALIYAEMRRPPENFGRFIANVPGPLFMALPFETLWSHARGGVIHAGDVAPDFELQTLDKSATVRLSSFRGSKPVVLIFGSYT